MRITICLSIMFVLAAGIDSTSHAQSGSKNGVKSFSVSPQGKPERALKYRLLPTVYEQQPGNAAVTYMMAASALPDKAWPESHDEWLEMPLEKFPVEKVKAAIRDAGDLGLLHDAARRMRVEWDSANVRINGFAALLPQITHHRTLARRLALRIRIHVKQKNYDRAIEDIKTGMALGHHLEEGSTLIESLIGIAICSMMCDRVEELIQQPDAPNLHWALADLPRPLVNMRQGLEYEQYWMQFMIKEMFAKQADRPFGVQAGSVPKDFALLISALTNEFSVDPSEKSEREIQARLAAAGMAIYNYPRAKRFFMEKKGMTEAEVDKLPVSQVSFNYEMDRYAYWRDEMFKWYALPYWQALKGLGNAEDEFQRAAKQHESGILAAMVLPAISSAKRAEVRLDRRVAAIQIIEGLRMHAAKHGSWPESLDVMSTPAPVDPFSGKQFNYSVEKGVATLTGSASTKDRGDHAINYRITLRK